MMLTRIASAAEAEAVEAALYVCTNVLRNT